MGKSGNFARIGAYCAAARQRPAGSRKAGPALAG